MGQHLSTVPKKHALILKVTHISQSESVLLSNSENIIHQNVLGLILQSFPVLNVTRCLIYLSIQLIRSETIILSKENLVHNNIVSLILQSFPISKVTNLLIDSPIWFSQSVAMLLSNLKKILESRTKSVDEY